MSRLVEIVPLDISDQGLLSALAAEIERVYSLDCRVVQAAELPVDCLDMGRQQYHATCILEHLADARMDAFRLLGVCAVDLFTPVLRYVFGEAMLPGRAALLSTYRLGIIPPGDKTSGDRSVFTSRVLKEGVHELGHTFGLTHCKDPECAMAASLDTGHIDVKQTRLCYYCKVILGDKLESK